MQYKRETIAQQFPWHVALLSESVDSIESLTSGRVTSYDCNVEDYSGFSALHCLIFKLLVAPDFPSRVTYKSIVLFLHTGFAVESQCKLGFTPLCIAFLARIQQSRDFTSSKVIDSLVYSKVRQGSELKCPNYPVLRNICLILLDNGASLKVNRHQLSPLSYTQLYYHTSPDAQHWLLFNYPRNVMLEELFKLSLLKAVTPETNYNAVLMIAIKHGIPFQHQSVNTEISLKSILCVLIQINYCIGLEEFCYIYNLPSYHCRQLNPDASALCGQVLEIIGAACYFVNTTYGSSREIQSQSARSHSVSFCELSIESRVFLVLTILIALWGSLVHKEIDYPYLVELLSKEFRSESILHLIITTKDLWSKGKQKNSSRRSLYFSEYLSLIYDGLWYTVAQLMSNQVNNRHKGYSPLHLTAINCDIEATRYLLWELAAYPFTVSPEGKAFYDFKTSLYIRPNILERKRFLAFIKSFVNQVLPLKTICATKLIAYGIDLKPLMRKSKLYSFVNLHKPNPGTK